MTFPKHSFLLFWCQLWLRSWSWSCRLWELQSYSWGDRREMSHSDHSPTFLSSSRGHREGPGIHDTLQLFCADITGRSFSKCKWRKRLLGSQPFSPIQGVTWRTHSTGWGRPEVSQVRTLHLRSQLGRESKKTLNLTGRQCLCGNKIGMKCRWAEKIGLLIPLGKETWQHCNRASKGKKHLSTARQERKFKIDKNITCKVTKKKRRKKTFKQHNTPITWQPGQWPTSNPLGPASGLYHHH